MNENQPAKTLHALTAKEWLHLETFIWEHIRSHTTTRLHVAGIMHAYGTRYNLAAMYRYLIWAQSQGEEPRAIMATIAHDLNARHQDPATFSPRTSTY